MLSEETLKALQGLVNTAERAFGESRSENIQAQLDAGKGHLPPDFFKEVPAPCISLIERVFWRIDDTRYCIGFYTLFLPLDVDDEIRKLTLCLISGGPQKRAYGLSILHPDDKENIVLGMRKALAAALESFCPRRSRKDILAAIIHEKFWRKFNNRFGPQTDKE